MKKIAFILTLLIISTISIVIYQYYTQINDETTSTLKTETLSFFGDRNSRHLDAAQKLGVTPVSDRNEAKKLTNNLIHIESNEYYKIDKLTHSIPYLTYRADSLLSLIGKNFQDSLRSKGYAKHRIIVTSVLRTENDVIRLRKSGNPNAAKHSAHMYATTFDITYARFDKLPSKSSTARTPSRNELRYVLSQVLKDLKTERKCYVLYELRQRCFHITTRIQ